MTSSGSEQFYFVQGVLTLFHREISECICCVGSDLGVVCLAFEGREDQRWTVIESLALLKLLYDLTVSTCGVRFDTHSLISASAFA